MKSSTRILFLFLGFGMGCTGILQASETPASEGESLHLVIKEGLDLLKGGKTASGLRRLAVAADLLDKEPDLPPLIRIKVRNFLAIKCAEQGDAERSILLLEKNLATCGKIWTEECSEAIGMANILGNHFKRRRQWAAGETCFLLGLKALKSFGAKASGPAESGISLFCNNLGTLLHAAGRPSEAEAYYLLGLDIPADHPDYRVRRTNLGQLYTSMGRLREAEKCFDFVETIMMANRWNARDVEQMSVYAHLLMLRRRHLEAIPILEKCLKFAGGNPLDRALHSDHLGGALLGAGFPDRALKAHLQSKAIRENTLGTHPDLAQSFNNLGEVQAARKEYASAEEYFRHGLKVHDMLGTAGSPEAAITWSNLSSLQSRIGNPRAAADARDQCQKILFRYLLRQLPSLNDREQAAYAGAHSQGDFTGNIYRGLRLVRDHVGDAHVRTRGLEWVTNGRRLPLQVGAYRHRLALKSSDPEVAAVLKELAEIRSGLAGVVHRFQPGKEDLERVRNTIVHLSGRQDKLQKALGASLKFPERFDQWVHVEDIRKKLPPRSVLIEFILSTLGSKDAAKGFRYGAFILGPEGPPDFIDFGPAEGIDAQVRAVRDALHASEKNFLRPLTPLSEAILHPLAKHPAVAGAEHLLIVPDHSLWLIPFAALRLPDGTYAVERFTISHLMAGKDLAQPVQPPATGPALILADPDFDHPLDEASPGKIVAEFGRLEGTGREVSAIRPHLQRILQEKPVVKTRGEAREGILLQADRPRMVYLATHGFFKENLTGIHPLLPCGLALSGANRRPKDTGPRTEDGLLTGLEIAATNLRGTRLVVLSSCDTAVGVSLPGQGMGDLRHAFLLAGAEGVLATLWKIPDEGTVPLMKSCLEHLGNSLPPAQALRKAQLQMLQAGRTRNDESGHPRNWAGFSFTTRTSPTAQARE